MRVRVCVHTRECALWRRGREREAHVALPPQGGRHFAGRYGVVLGLFPRAPHSAASSRFPAQWGRRAGWAWRRRRSAGRRSATGAARSGRNTVPPAPPPPPRLRLASLALFYPQPRHGSPRHSASPVSLQLLSPRARSLCVLFLERSL